MRTLLDRVYRYPLIMLQSAKTIMQRTKKVRTPRQFSPGIAGIPQLTYASLLIGARYLEVLQGQPKYLAWRSQSLRPYYTPRRHFFSSTISILRGAAPMHNECHRTQFLAKRPWSARSEPNQISIRHYPVTDQRSQKLISLESGFFFYFWSVPDHVISHCCTGTTLDCWTLILIMWRRIWPGRSTRNTKQRFRLPCVHSDLGNLD